MKPNKLNTTDLENFISGKLFTVINRSIRDADTEEGIVIDDAAAAAANDIFRGVLDSIRAALLKGRPVALFQIGTLKPCLRKGSTYKHPSTGEECVSEDRVSVKLVLSPNMRDDLRNVGRKVRASLAC